MSRLNGFMAFRANPYVQWRDLYITGTECNRKLKFSRPTSLTHMNIIFEYCHVSVILLDVLYLEDGNVYK